MKEFILKFKASEILFLMAGIGMLAVLPLYGQGSDFMWWSIPKIFYFTGILFFIVKK